MNETGLGARAWRERAIDVAIGASLFFGYLAWLLYTARDLGYARDEGFYFHAARTYGKWFELLWNSPAAALEPKSIDQYWRENHEHPALAKTLFWVSQRLFEGRLFEERGTAFRFPGMLLSSLAVVTTFGFGRCTLGRGPAVVAAIALACMPRVFYHAHLACFDMPITALLLLTVFAYYRSVQTRSIAWALATSVLYGLALNTKHNAWFLPAAIGVHALSRLWPKPRERWREGHAFALVPLGLMLLIGPLVFYATWPWLWHDTRDRLAEYVTFHLQHVYYNMEFLGRTYFEPPFPLSYAPLMTLATVPAITLLLAGLGFGSWLRQRSFWFWTRRGAKSERPQVGATTDAGAGFLWLCCILVSYGPWTLPTTPIFGGTKHWMTAYPYLALFAGQGFSWLCALLEQAVPRSTPRRRRLLALGLALSVLAAPLVMTAHSHPFGLSAYTPLVGGAPGAATLGLNRTFWGYTTGSVTDFLNETAAPDERVFIHDTAMDSFRMLQKDHRLRSDLKPWWTVAGSKIALYHHEQHMSRVEYMIWADYGTAAPAYVATYDGVPVVWVYARGRRSDPAR